MRYGAVPIVCPTGGLADTVADGVNGFCFAPHGPEPFVQAVERAVQMWREAPRRFAAIQEAGMQRDWSWRAPAAAYAALYQRLRSAPTITP